jgi:lauroyl/myristoyl acyltransferase
MRRRDLPDSKPVRKTAGAGAEAVARLRLALDLFEAGESIMRQNLRRRFPEASAAEIEGRLDAWLSERAGAEFGDAVGRPTTWPRPKS